MLGMEYKVFLFFNYYIYLFLSFFKNLGEHGWAVKKIGIRSWTF